MIIERNQEDKLIKLAETEEKRYNWLEAAQLYEQAVDLLIDRRKQLDASYLYYKIGDIYIRSVHASNSREEYQKNTENAIKAYSKAEELFLKNHKKSLSSMSKCKALTFSSLTETSSEVAKAALKEAIKICLDLNGNYSKNADTHGQMESSILLLNSISYILYLCKEPSEFEYYLKIGFHKVEEAWSLLQKVDNFEYRVNILYWENNLYFSNNQTQISYSDKKNEENVKKSLLRKEETLEMFRDIEDFFLLGRFYANIGMSYCIYGALFSKDQSERLDFVDRGFDFLEKSLIFCRAARNNIDLVYAIYFLDYFIGIFGRFEYYQKRIVKDVYELQKLNEVYKDFHTFYSILTSRISLMYYNNFAGRSFLKDDIRKAYAKMGINLAQEQLKKIPYGPYIVINYQLLTQFYSYLIDIATKDDPIEGFIQKMFYYADLAESAAKLYIGGHSKSAGFNSIYRANKTKAELATTTQDKIHHLEIALKAQKSNLNYAFESDSINLATHIRLGLLYEEIGILGSEENSLLNARKRFLKVIEKATERGYDHYSAACYEYIARLEDRLGNNLISAEYYVKAKKSHTKSLIQIKFKPLKDRVNEKINYAKAWNLIEIAKDYHKREKHLDAKQCYEDAIEILNKLNQFNYEAAYYGAWVFLEEAEDFSKREKFEEARKSYEKSRDMFDNAIYSIRFIRKTLRKSKELKKLEKVAKIRMKYCSARIDLDEARILGKMGDHLAAAEKFHKAANQFSDICILFKIQREKDELEATYHLCKAWQNMELAESHEDPEKFADAAELFAKASKFFKQSKLKFLALGNSNFCLALEVGCKFDQSHDILIKKKLYPSVKFILRKAADFYEKGGFNNASEWALGTSVYFDAAWYLIQADVELNITKKQELLKLGAEYLKSAADLFLKAGYFDKQREVLERLERVSKEKRILVSALNTINEPSVSRSIEGIITPSCPIETSQSPRI
ncbi:MAG: hypothetical protein ACFE8G_13715, partial [Candidatus Hermodarchaeota archaeon]